MPSFAALCCVPASRSVVERSSSDTWLSLLFLSAWPEAKQLLFRQVADALASDHSNLKLLLDSDVVRDATLCLADVTSETSRPRSVESRRGSCVSLLRNLLIPLCEDQTAAAEVADSEELCGILMYMLRTGLCAREVLCLMSLIVCCPEGCVILSSGEFDCLSLLLRLAQGFQLPARRGSTLVTVMPPTSSGAGGPVIAQASSDGDDGLALVHLSAVLSLARLCGEAESMEALRKCDVDFSAVWAMLLAHPSLKVQQRAVLGIKYMLLTEAGQAALTQPLLDGVLNVLLRLGATAGDNMPVVDTCLEALGLICRPYPALLPSAALLLAHPRLRSEVVPLLLELVGTAHRDTLFGVCGRVVLLWLLLVLSSALLSVQSVCTVAPNCGYGRARRRQGRGAQHPHASQRRRRSSRRPGGCTGTSAATRSRACLASLAACRCVCDCGYVCM